MSFVLILMGGIWRVSAVFGNRAQCRVFSWRQGRKDFAVELKPRDYALYFYKRIKSTKRCEFEKGKIWGKYYI